MAGPKPPIVYGIQDRGSPYQSVLKYLFPMIIIDQQNHVMENV